MAVGGSSRQEGDGRPDWQPGANHRTGSRMAKQMASSTPLEYHVVSSQPPQPIQDNWTVIQTESMNAQEPNCCIVTTPLPRYRIFPILLSTKFGRFLPASHQQPISMTCHIKPLYFRLTCAKCLYCRSINPPGPASSLASPPRRNRKVELRHRLSGYQMTSRSWWLSISASPRRPSFVLIDIPGYLLHGIKAMAQSISNIKKGRYVKHSSQPSIQV